VPWPAIHADVLVGPPRPPRARSRHAGDRRGAAGRERRNDPRRRDRQRPRRAGRTAPGRPADPQLLLLALAGHETTANSLAWAILEQARAPDSQARASDEARDADLTALALDADRFTWAERQFREALRLYPPVHSLIRRLVAPLTIAGVQVPAGTLISVPVVHFLRDPGTAKIPARTTPVGSRRARGSAPSTRSCSADSGTQSPL